MKNGKQRSHQLQEKLILEHYGRLQEQLELNEVTSFRNTAYGFEFKMGMDTWVWQITNIDNRRFYSKLWHKNNLRPARYKSNSGELPDYHIQREGYLTVESVMKVVIHHTGKFDRYQKGVAKARSKKRKDNYIHIF